jgi:hypothetical protein
MMHFPEQRRGYGFAVLVRRWRSVEREPFRCRRWSTAVGADDTDGQCDSSVRLVPVRRLMPTVKDPPVGCLR